MNKPIRSERRPVAAIDDGQETSFAPSQRAPDQEMARVLKTTPLRINLDRSGSIAVWQHDPVHDIVKPMADHVVMAYPAGRQRLERRNGNSVAIGTARPGVITIIPAGTTSRWDVTPLGASGRSDIERRLNLIQLYLPHSTLERVAREASTVASSLDLIERIGHPDPIAYQLLTNAADAIQNDSALDTFFRRQLTGALATRLLIAHSGSGVTVQPAVGGLSPAVLRRTIERLRSDDDADVSLGALASDAGLSRFHFCRAFKESTGLSPHCWLRQHRLEQAMNLLRDTDAPVVAIAEALGYGSQTAFAAAFKRLTGRTPSHWRRRACC